MTFAAQSTVDAIVVEIADGLLHEETAALVTSRTFGQTVDGIVFCAGDALGAQAGVDWLEMRGLPVIGVSGALTASSLARREARRATRVPILTRERLCDPAFATTLLSGAA